MSFPSGPEYASYIALCRELRLKREVARGDYVAWHVGGDPLLWAADQSPSSDIWVWLPRLDQLLLMLEGKGVRDVGFWALDDCAKCGALTPGDFDGISYGDLETATTREEAALRLWIAVTRREARA